MLSPRTRIRAAVADPVSRMSFVVALLPVRSAPRIGRRPRATVADLVRGSGRCRRLGPCSLRRESTSPSRATASCRTLPNRRLIANRPMPVFAVCLPAESRTLGDGEVCVAALAFSDRSRRDRRSLALFARSTRAAARSVRTIRVIKRRTPQARPHVIEESFVRPARARGREGRGAGRICGRRGARDQQSLGDDLRPRANPAAGRDRCQSTAGPRDDWGAGAPRARHDRRPDGLRTASCADPERLLLNDLAKSVIDRFAETARSQSCRIRLAAAGPVFATADPDAIANCVERTRPQQPRGDRRDQQSHSP